MSATPTPDQSDEPIQRVRDALGAEMFFDAERIAVTSMQDAHTLGDYAQMAQLSEVLREARRGKLDAAVSAAGDHVVVCPINFVYEKNRRSIFSGYRFKKRPLKEEVPSEDMFLFLLFGFTGILLNINHKQLFLIIPFIDC